MKYYILLPGDTESVTMYDSNILGEYSFKKFTPNQGFEVLTKIVSDAPHLLETVRIINERGKKYSVEQFLNEIAKK